MEGAFWTNHPPVYGGEAEGARDRATEAGRRSLQEVKKQVKELVRELLEL